MKIKALKPYGCGDKCLNGGICERSGRCICNPRYSGEFCQFSNFEGEYINGIKQKCETKCENKEIMDKKTCHYKGLNSTVTTCRCENKYDLIGESQCNDVFENFVYCKLDCQNYFANGQSDNNTRVCRYFYDESKIQTCRCENSVDGWCIDFQEYSHAFIFVISIFVLFFLITCSAFRLMYSKVSGEWTPVANG